MQRAFGGTNMCKALAAAVAAMWTVAAVPAGATWLEASTDHFIIDANTTEPRLRDFAAKLERFDAALHKIYNVADDPARRADRVRIYAIPLETLQRLYGSRGVGGFYITRAGRSVIFTSALAPSAKGDLVLGSLTARRTNADLDAQSTLLHEYSHHFMYVNFPRAYPLWFSEGFAEFNGNARFEADGSVTVGSSPVYRSIGPRGGTGVNITELLDPPKRVLSDSAGLDRLYGRGWLLTHYLLVEGNKQKELSTYIDKLNAGTPSVTAARESFGDLDALSKQMDALLFAKGLVALRTLPIPIGAITITPLSPGAAAMMTIRLQSEHGVTDAQAASVAAQAEKIAAAYPADLRVQTELAEAEHDAGHDDLADAAADRALAVDPKSMDALILKGQSAVHRLETAHSRDAAQWKAARRWFVRANNAVPDAAEPLLLYYRSFLSEGVAAPASAYAGLIRAQQLAPEDSSIRIQLAQRMIADGKIDDARAMLRPIAYAPHGGGKAAQARIALGELDSDKREASQRTLATSETPTKQ